MPGLASDMASGSQTLTANAINSSSSSCPALACLAAHQLDQLAPGSHCVVCCKFHYHIDQPRPDQSQTDPTRPELSSAVCSAVTIFIYIYMSLRLGLPGLDLAWLGLAWLAGNPSTSPIHLCTRTRPAVPHLIVTFELLSYCRDKLIVKSCNCLTMLAKIISLCGSQRRDEGTWGSTTDRRYKDHDDCWSASTHILTKRTHPSRHNPRTCSSV